MKLLKRVLLPCLMFFLVVINVRAENLAKIEEIEGAFDENGNQKYEVIYSATAKRRTTNTAWRTVGFTIRKEEMGDVWYSKDPRYYPDAGKGNLSLDEEKNKVDYPDGAKVTTIFTVPYEDVTQRFKKAVVNQYNSVSVNSIDEWFDYKKQQFDKNPANAGKEFKRWMYLDGYFQKVTYPSLSSTTPNWHSGNYYIASQINSMFNDYSAFKQRYDIKIEVPPTDPYPLILETYIKTKVKQSDGTMKYQTVQSKSYSEKIPKAKYHDTKITIRALSSDKDADLYIAKHLEKDDFASDVSELKNTPHDKFYIYKVRYRIKKNNDEDEWGSAKGTINLEGNPEGTAAQKEAYQSSWEDMMPLVLKMQRYGLKLQVYMKPYFSDSSISSGGGDDPDPESGVGSELEEDITEPTVSAVIKADARGSEEYDNEEGIPTTESQYVQVYADNALVSYRFTKYTGKASFQGEVDGNLQVVEREYSYWKVSEFTIWNLKNASVLNYSLPNGVITLTPQDSYTPITATYVGNGGIVTQGGFGNDYTVKNDKLVVNGVTILSAATCTKQTSAPKVNSLQTIFNQPIGRNVLYKPQLYIGATKSNGEFSSSGSVTYEATTYVGANQTGDTEQYEIDDVNPVVIHTPVVCYPGVEDVRGFNQMITPNDTMPGLVLDREFRVSFPTTGQHREIRGYGYNDYKKYMSLYAGEAGAAVGYRQIRFPFDVYMGITYVKRGTWITIDRDITTYYVERYTIGGWSFSFHSLDNLLRYEKTPPK